jgi:hypothetical protein
MLDSSVGLILSYGADGIAGGEGEDDDIVVRYIGPLKIRRARLFEALEPTGEGESARGSDPAAQDRRNEGAGGGPHAARPALRAGTGQRLELQFNKPFVRRGTPQRDVCVITDAQHGGRGFSLAGDDPLSPSGAERAAWEVIEGPAGTDERTGRLVFRCTAGDPGCPIRFSTPTAVDIGPAHRAPDSEAVASTIFEAPIPGGPLDPVAHGEKVLRPMPARGLELVGGEHRGVPLEIVVR